MCVEIEKIIKTISDERFSSYLKRYPDNLKKSFFLYQSNIEISQAFYSSLSILEISLRNRINESFIKHFTNKSWYKENLPKELSKQIKETEVKLIKSGKKPTIDRVIAELNFGFWTMLFNRKYAKYFWKPLLKAFPYIPRDKRKRTFVSAKLNHIRTFRNRIYHYDPIIWNIQEVITKRKEIFEIMSWIEPEMAKWAKSIDTFEEVKDKIKKNV